MYIDTINIGDIKETTNYGNYEVLEKIDNQHLRIRFVLTQYERIVNIKHIPKGQISDDSLVYLKEGTKFKSKNSGEFKILYKTEEQEAGSHTFLYKIEFLITKYRRLATKSKILKGQVQDNSLFQGIVGKGKYSRENDFVGYMTWKNMLNRCNTKLDPHFINYDTVTIEENWYIFQNFMEWFELQEYKGEDLSLDKDILCNIKDINPKIYSSETCLLVPIDINGFLAGYGTDSNISTTKTGKFRLQIINKGIKVSFTFGTLKEAQEVKSNLKQKYWFDLLEEYKDKLSNNLINILKQYNFKIK